MRYIASIGVLIALMGGIAWALPQEEARSEPPPRQKPQEPWLDKFWGMPDVHGSLSMRYRVRDTSDARDQDLYESLSVDIGKAEHHRVTAHFFVRATEDIDGNRENTGYYVFDSIADSYDSRLYSRLYYAHLDVHEVGPLDLIRGGRQFLNETPTPFYLDGVWVESKELQGWRGLKIATYGGVPVHPFESSPSGDSIWGVQLQSRPWKGAQARLDYTRVIDDYTMGEEQEERSDLWGLGFAQRCSEKFSLSSDYSVLEGESHSVTAKGTVLDAGSDLQMHMAYTQLFKTQKSLATDVDAFFSAAAEYDPYRQGRIMATKGFGTHVLVQMGADVRELVNDSEEAPLNHEFRRFWITPTFTDWPWPGITLGPMWEIWDVPGSNERDIRTGGFDVTWAPSKEFKATVGTAYALYTYDYFDSSEREDVRTYYARVRAVVRSGLKIDLLLEYEDGDVEDAKVLKVGVTQSF